MYEKFSHNNHDFSIDPKKPQTKGTARTHAELMEADQFSAQDVADSGLSSREKVAPENDFPILY